MKAARNLFILLMLLFVLLLGSPADAGFTSVHPSGGGQVSLAPVNGILDTLYGLENLSRIHDFSAIPTDQHWFNKNGSSTAVARYAGNANTLGYVQDGGTFTSLFTVSGSGYAVSGTGSLAIGPYWFNWALSTPGNTNTFYSTESLNSDSLDHMVTYLITGTAGGHLTNVVGNYIIAWEDILGAYGSSPSDRDFNDLVVEVHKVSVVPEPATMVISALTLIGGGAFVRRRFFKQV